MSEQALIPIGRIVRLQVQTDPLKIGDKPFQQYSPVNIRSVEALVIEPAGVIGLDGDEVIGDVHHRDHPRSRFRGENGVSIGFTSHYAAMRARFGGHLTDGIAGENILVACGGPVALAEIAGGIVIGEGDDAVTIDEWIVAAPCAPFTRFCLRYPADQKPDRRVTEGLQFLDDGMRGFYGRFRNPACDGATRIEIGATVYRRR
jgi:hypothetical protein